MQSVLFIPSLETTINNDKIRYNDTLTGAKHSLKKWQFTRIYANTSNKKNICLGYYPKHVVCGNKNKNNALLTHHSAN